MGDSPQQPGDNQARQNESDSSAFAAFDLFRDYLDKKLYSFKKDILESTSTKADEVAKKLKIDHSYQFKFKGNQKQFEFNEQLSADFKKIERASQSGNLNSIQETCQNAQKELHKRNKCIKMADKSPAGWDTVNEYLSDELASDSEDEKRMRYAENRALRARKLRRQSNNPRRVQVSRQPTSPPIRYSAPAATVTSVTANDSFRGFRKYTAKPTDICFACSQPGHWRRDCKKPTAASKD